jgi:hypothetical protein
MPPVKITAISSEKLPSVLKMRTWIEGWTNAAGGAWNAPNYNGNECTVTFAGITLAAASPVVQNTIDTYNNTNTGSDMITVSLY